MRAYSGVCDCLPSILHSNSKKRETRRILLLVACLFGYDPLERSCVLHCFVPWLQVVPRVPAHTTLASVQFMPRIASLRVFADGIWQARWSPKKLLICFFRFVRRARSATGSSL